MALVVGDRVRLTNDVERYPHFIAKGGSAGTVTEVGENVIVKMDEHIPGAEEWENEVHWHLPNEDDPEADLRPETRAELVEALQRFNPFGSYCLEPCSHAGHTDEAYQRTVAKVRATRRS